MELLDTAIICLYFVAITYFGLFTVKPALTIEEYAVGNKNMSTYSMIGTIFATWIGSVALIDTINKGFSIGISYFIIVLGDALNLMISGFLGKYFHQRFSKAISIGDLIQPIYGTGARIISGIISTLVCLFYVSAQLKVINLLFEYFFSIPHVISITLSTLIIILYSTLGGVNSVIKTDKLQFVIILVFIVLLLNNVAPKSLQSLPIDKLTFNIDKNFLSNHIWLFLGFFTPLLLPNIIQRILISKNANQCKNAFMVSSVLSMIFYLLCIILGIFAFSLNKNLNESEVLLFLLQQNLSTGFLGIGFIGVLSILISTADSFMNISAISITRDIIKPIFNTGLSNKAELNLAMCCNILLSMLACFLSISFDQVLKIILYALNLWGPIMSIPIYFALFNLKVDKSIFYISLIASVIVLVFWEHQFNGIDELFAFIPATFTSLMIFGCSWLIKKIRTPHKITNNS